mmetsp:Transcript_43267/g.139021  ORF Transcript_43267/g.139021 Transcript_43267/m.139021 type:complete len:264 (-) Transcript_43267:178-969(-)
MDYVYVGAVVLATICLALLVHYCGIRALSKAIEAAIEKADEDILGVQVEIDSMRFHPFLGQLEIRHFTMRNPPGFTTKYLMQAKHLYLDLNVRTALCSLGKHIIIEEIKLADVEVTVEMTGPTTSNISAVMDHMKEKQEHHESGEAEGKSDSRAALLPPKPADATNLEPAPAVKLEVHKVCLTGISAELTSFLTGENGLVLAIADIVYDNFSRDNPSAVSTAAIVRIVAKSLFKSVGHNLAGKGVSDAIVKGGRGCTRMCTFR